jgi:hypothetical protein
VHYGGNLILAGSCSVEPTRVVPYMPPLDARLDTVLGIVEPCIVLQIAQLWAEFQRRQR